MESHLVRIINRLEMMAADGGNLSVILNVKEWLLPKYHLATIENGWLHIA